MEFSYVPISVFGLGTPCKLKCSLNSVFNRWWSLNQLSKKKRGQDRTEEKRKGGEKRRKERRKEEESKRIKKRESK